MSKRADLLRKIDELASPQPHIVQVFTCDKRPMTDPVLYAKVSMPPEAGLINKADCCFPNRVQADQWIKDNGATIIKRYD